MQYNKTVSDVSELSLAAKVLLEQFYNRTVFLFSGDMGAGKTTFIKEIAKLIGVRANMSSPSYSIVNEYQINNGILYHFDLYRLNNITECLDIGMDEYLYSGNYCFIEWPGVAEELYPQDSVRVSITIRDGKRVISAL